MSIWKKKFNSIFDWFIFILLNSISCLFFGFMSYWACTYTASFIEMLELLGIIGLCIIAYIAIHFWISEVVLED